MLVALFVGIEAGDVGTVGVDDSRVAVVHPFGDDLSHAGAFLDPHGGGRPQVAHVRDFAQARHGVGCERQQAVDRVLDLGIAEHVHQFDGLFHLHVEVVGREGHLGGRQRRFGIRRNLVGVVQDRTVGVAADLHRAGRLALVAERVHVANDRIADLIVGFDEDVHRADVGHLVHGGDERDVCAGHVCDAVRPDAAGDHDVLGLDRALVGHDGFDRAHAGNGVGFGDQIEDLGVRVHLEAGRLDRFLAHHGAGLERVDDRHGRAVEATQDDVLVDERHELFDAGGRDQLGLDAPGGGRGDAAVELGHAFGRAGHLDAAGVDAQAKGPVLVGALLAEQRHLLVVIDGEDEVRRVPCRSTWVRQWALVDQDHVGPAESGQMADEAVADDAGADDDNFGGGGEVTHVFSPGEEGCAERVEFLIHQ